MILLVGETGGADDLGGSHYLKVVHGRKAGRPPRLNYAREKAVQAAVLALIRAGLVRSAHDCSEGGLAVAVAESCVSGDQRFGAALGFDAIPDDPRPDVLLFNEAASRIILTVAPADEDDVRATLHERGVPPRRLGVVGARDGELSVNLPGGRKWNWETGALHEAWYHSIARALEG